MNECEEIAVTMQNDFSGCTVFDHFLAVVRRKMPGESETIINNVAWAAYRDARKREDAARNIGK